MKIKSLGLRVTVLSIALAFTLGMMSGCGTATKSNGGGAAAGTGDSSAKAKVSAPAKISMAIGYSGTEYPQPGNEVQAKIEEYTNTKLDIKAYADTTLHEMLPVMIASGDMPNILSYGGSQLSKSYIANAFDGGVFWDIAPYISQYPNLSKINPLVFDTFKKDGKIFGVPKVRPLARSAFIYRKDWADTLGMKEPATIDEAYALFKAFTKNDPDKNGKNDTFGLTSGSSVVTSFGVFFGAPNVWDMQNGKFIKAEATEEFLNGLKFSKKLIQEGIIHPEVIIMDRSQYEALFYDGKAGTYANVTSYTGYEDKIKTKDPKAKLAAFSVLAGPNGKRTSGGTGHNGIMSISKSSVKTEADLKNILNFFDKLADEKMANLLYYGIENMHYKVENGLAVRIPEMNKDYLEKVNLPYASPIAALLPITTAMKGKMTIEEETESRLNAENEKYAVMDPSLGLFSDTNATMGADLTKILTDACNKFVMGAIDEAKYKSEVKRWADGGGNKIADELAAQYAKYRKK